MKSYRGRFNAFLANYVKLLDNDLKTIYDPSAVREDYLIENIINEEKIISTKISLIPSYFYSIGIVIKNHYHSLRLVHYFLPFSQVS